MEPARHSLAEIRAWLGAQSEDDRRVSRLVASLCSDRRSGARALGDSWQRRIDGRRRDRRRVSRLFRFHRELRRCGLERIAGVDEVGMGPLAGPVVAAAVVLPGRVDLPGLDDSKRVPREARERLAAAIRRQALAVGVGRVDPDEIDRLNIYHAGLLAMRRALRALGRAPDHVILDARSLPDGPWPQTPIVGGDRRDGSVAAASIVAKVHRDAIMRRLDRAFPGYGLARNMGYGTAEHVEALRRRGASAIHRRSFAPVAEAARP